MDGLHPLLRASTDLTSAESIFERSCQQQPGQSKQDVRNEKERELLTRRLEQLKTASNLQAQWDKKDTPSKAYIGTYLYEEIQMVEKALGGKSTQQAHQTKFDALSLANALSADEGWKEYLDSRRNVKKRMAETEATIERID